ncbi:MAG: hypothetical protein WC389_05385 [Lutibacter sp.]|jgi:hypothetical protein
MKKGLQIVLIIVLLLIGVYFFIKKFMPMMAMKFALTNALRKFSRNIVENVERIYRHETAHFQSVQFLGTFSPGMEKFSETYPYGWNSLKPFWDKNPSCKPIGFKHFIENGTGKIKYFLKFASPTGGVMTLAYFLETHQNNPGRWFSLEIDKQIKYTNMILKIKPIYTNEIS